MPERSAIRNLIDEVAAARSLRHLYDSALAALGSVLGIERAAVLVRDTDGVMRFVASRGLSDDYMAAVEGHSPWAADDPDPHSVLVPDVSLARELASFENVFARERIRALAFIPMRFGQRLLGKFMLYRDEPYIFSSNEISVAEIIAGHIAFALEHRRIAAELEARARSERELRRQAEQEASLRQEDERRLRIAMAAGQMGAWSWEVGGKIEWSPELARLHGVEAEAFDGSFESFLEHTHPEDRPRLEATIRRALRDSTFDYEIEYRIRLADGTPRWMSARGKVLFDERGQPLRMVGVCSDASGRKRAAETETFLMQTSRMLATTLDPELAVQSLATLVVPRFADWCLIETLDDTGRLRPIGLSHSDPAKSALGWEIARAARNRIGEIVVRTGESRLIPRIEPDLLADGIPDRHVLQRIESLGLCSAMTVPLAVRGRILGALSLISSESLRVFGAEDLRLAEEIGSWAALAIDNAELFRRAEEARGSAEDARRRLQTVAELSDELASSLDPYAMLEKLAERIVETMADYAITYEFDGHSIRRLGIAHRIASKRPTLRRLDETGGITLQDTVGAGYVIRTGQPILAESVDEEALRQAARSPAQLEALLALEPTSAMIVPMKARGRTIGAISFVTTTDSDRRYRQDDLKLGLALATRAALFADNARLYAKARSAIKARDDMLAVVSHDLRNPLQSISTAATLLKVAPAGEHTARTIESVSVAAAQMERLLNDLLDISRMEAGKFLVQPQPADLRSLLDEAIMLFSVRADQKGVRLESSIAEGLPRVRLDRPRIVQVLANLIGNALRFVETGGRIDVSVDRHRNGVRVTVTDDGPGIDAEHLPKVFDRFWRANGREEGGAGLGLALAKGIVEAHGGTLGVHSRAGEGARFFFTIPVPAAALAPPRRDAGSRAAEQPTLRS